jgi:GntR family transcriptional regulator/MocR family aminotransferase
LRVPVRGQACPCVAGPPPAVYAGTFSKTLFPALRLGYLVVPESLVDRMEAIKSTTNRHAPVLDQAALHAFIAEGHFIRHVRRMRAVYEERLALLLEEARAKLDGSLTITGIDAGLQTAGWLAAGIDAERVATAAAQLGVEVTPLSRYAKRELSREGLQLGFAAIHAREIRRGVENLARVLGDPRIRS